MGEGFVRGEVPRIIVAALAMTNGCISSRLLSKIVMMSDKVYVGIGGELGSEEGLIPPAPPPTPL